MEALCAVLDLVATCPDVATLKSQKWSLPKGTMRVSALAVCVQCGYACASCMHARVCSVRVCLHAQVFRGRLACLHHFPFQMQCLPITPHVCSLPQTLRDANNKLVAVRQLVDRAFNTEVLCKVRAQW